MEFIMNNRRKSIMFRFSGIAVFIILFFAASGIRVLAGELILAQDGKSEYTIVLSMNASASEKHVAKELQRFLTMMSGVTIPVCREN